MQNTDSGDKYLNTSNFPYTYFIKKTTMLQKNYPEVNPRKVCIV